MTWFPGDLQAPLNRCRQRVVTADPQRFRCLHPQVHAEDGFVTPHVCRRCDLFDDRAMTWRFDLDGDVLTEPTQRLSWAVGVTTAPRRRPTLRDCLTSLRRGGFDRVRVFAEPEVDLSMIDRPNCVTQRESKLGAFPNWYLGFAELVIRHPEVDAYLMVQDDSVFAKGTRQYLEHALWPNPQVGVVSLYCPSHYSEHTGPAAPSRGFRAVDFGWNSWGALAYVFPNHAARQLLANAAVLEHRLRGPDHGLRNIDSVVGAWASAESFLYCVHVPSLVQHVGETSTIYPDATASGKRVASDFVPDVSDWISPPRHPQAARWNRHT